MEMGGGGSSDEGVGDRGIGKNNKGCVNKR